MAFSKKKRENNKKTKISYEPDDPENHVLKDNSRKKTYAEVTQETCMQVVQYGADDETVDEEPLQESDTDDQPGMDDTHTRAEDVPHEED